MTQMISELLEAGLLAGRYGHIQECDQIFEALEQYDARDESTRVGKALTRIYTNRPEDAVRILQDEALALNPENAVARGFLGLALKMSGRHEEAEQVLQAVVYESGHEVAIEFARSVLEEPALADEAPAW